ncbi:MAG TPA: RHS repeat-associated core domain-containing protein [Gemmatimonadales bacterium]|nr:RHS repeat-associated core domain-containing protein [Gemmatimonadales bacterium]
MTPASATLSVGERRVVTVTVNVGATSGTVLMTATGHATDQGSYNVTVVPPGPPVVALRHHNGDHRDRSFCLTSGAGEASAWQCGDLLVSHSMPGYMTMGRERSLTLLYNSAQAVPKPVVVATVNQANIAQPTSVYAELTVSGAIRASATYTGWGNAPFTRQIALTYDASADATGLYPFTLLVRNQYTGSSYDAVLSDTLIVVNRSASEFGAGWWLAGVEQLYPGQPGNKILWVGGDGSAKVYRSVGTDVWQAAAGAYRDTLRYDPGTLTYTRTLRHGIQVKYDASGRHIETVNRTGQKTVFTWSGSPLRLTRIQVPPQGVAGTTYTLAYDAGGTLDRITDPALRVLDATVASGRLTSLVDPDNYSTGFAYDASGRMTQRTTRRGYTTHFTYAKGLRVTRVSVPLDPSVADSAITTFDPWDEKGLATGPSGQLAVDTAQGFTKIFGPRLNVADDATFWVDRWGAPVKIVNPIGATTTLVRGDAAVPALVTRVKYPDGRVVDLNYDARGNLLQQRDSTLHLVDGQPTAVSTWTYNSPNTKDAPDSFTDPEGVMTRYAYNTWGILSQATAPNGHVTDFEFEPNGALVGLLRAVIERVVPAWDTITKTEVTQDLQTAFAFNELGNDTSVTTPMGHRTRHVRDNVQRVTNVYDPAGHRTELVYDALNRVLQSIQHPHSSDTTFATPLITRQHFTIDVLDSIVDPRGVARGYRYDAANRRTQEVDDYGSVERTFYDRAGNVDSIRPRFYVTLVIRHAYDEAGRLTKKAWPARETLPADSVLYTYDLVGRVLTATQSNREVARTYFPTGMLKSEVQSLPDGTNPFTHRYSYDRAGRRTWYVVGTPANISQSDSVAYRYHAVTGDLEWIGVRWRGLTAVDDSVRFAWDALGRRDTVVYRNETQVRFAYDGDGLLRLVCGVHPGGASPDVFDLTSYYQSVAVDGLILRTTHSSAGLAGCGENLTLQGVHVNTYDSRHQLLSQAQFGKTTLNRYDFSGNITRITEQGGTDRDDIFFISPRHNRIDSLRFAGTPNTGRNFVYDLNGSRIDEVPVINGQEDPNGFNRRMYYYDGLNRATGSADYINGQWVPNPGRCKYDPLGRLWDPCDNHGNALGFDGENAVRTAHDVAGGWTFVHGPGLDDPVMGYRSINGRRLYWVTDGQGRQFAVGDVSGADFSADFEYVDAGGKYAGGTRNATTFAPQRNDDPSMYNMSFFRNRFYDQQTGRWTQEDPIGVAGGTNLYAYVGNNPVTFTDPFGLCEKIAGTTAPCELFAAVFSEAAPGQAAEANAISHAIVNRALDDKHTYAGVRNTGDLFTDVTAHATSSDVQGTGNRQYAAATAYIQTGSGLDAAQKKQFDLVVQQAENAYTGRSKDPTKGATFWDHAPSRPGQGASQKYCAPEETGTIGTARFARCTK